MDYSGKFEVTELKNKIEALEENQLRLQEQVSILQNILKHSPDPLVILNADKLVIHANQAASDLFGIGMEAFIGRSIIELIGFQSQEEQDYFLKNNYFNEKLNLSIFDNQLVKNITMIFLGEMDHNRYLYRIKSLLKQNNFQRRDDYKELIEDFFIKFTDGLIVFDRKGIIIRVNPAFCQSLGIIEEHLEGASIFSLIDSAEKDSFFYIWQELMENGVYIGEVTFSTKSTKKVFQVSISSRVQNGLYMAGFREDSKKTEMVDRLNQSEERFHRVFEGLTDGMILWTDNEIDFYDEINLVASPNKFFYYKQDGITLYSINSTGIDILNLDPNLPLDKQIDDLVIIDESETNNFYQFIKNLHLKNEEYRVAKLELHDKIKSIEFYTIPIMKDLNLSIFRDVTTRLQMEDNLRQSEMLNVLGELAAGIAHEIRNPMTSLKGFIQLLQSSVSGYSMYFNIILAELERIDSIVNEFLYLAKPQSVKFKHVNITKIMQETIDLFNAQAFMKNIQIKTNFTRNDLSVYCEPNQIKQVFINIIKNAIEVMSKGGTVSIRIREEKKAPFLKVSIRDEGGGIPKEKIKKLGQPFFTTKEKGTGLGLMVSYKIIREHGGRIEVDSKFGVGTVFHIFLPLQKEEDNLDETIR